MKVVDKNLFDLREDPANANTHPADNIEAIKRSLRRFGAMHPIVVDSSGIVRAGNGRLRAARELGWKRYPCIVSDLPDAELRLFAIADNRTAEMAQWDREALRAALEGLPAEQLEATGFDAASIEALFSAPASEPQSPGGASSGSSGALARRFGLAPFSVFDARRGEWQERKQAWIDLGIASEIGRGENLLKLSDRVRLPPRGPRAAAPARGGSAR